MRVPQGVVAVVLLAGGGAVGDLRQARQFVVAVGIVEGDAVDVLGLPGAVADAVVGVVVLGEDGAGGGAVHPLRQAVVGVVLVGARDAVGQALLGEASGRVKAQVGGVVVGRGDRRQSPHRVVQVGGDAPVAVGQAVEQTARAPRIDQTLAAPTIGHLSQAVVGVIQVAGSDFGVLDMDGWFVGMLELTPVFCRFFVKELEAM